MLGINSKLFIMKKILSLLLSALLAIFFVTCNSDDISNEDFPDNPETEEDFDVFIERLETEISNISDAVNALIDKYGSVNGMLNHIDEVAAVDGVSKIDTTEYILTLKTSDGFRISWERFPLGSLKGKTTEVNELNKLMAKSASSKNKENEHEHIFKDISGEGKKICIVNQTSNDDLFKEENELYEKLYLDLKNSGYNVDYVKAEDFTCQWIRSSMSKYSFILFNTHGGFDDGLHWFATGEKAGLFDDLALRNSNKSDLCNNYKVTWITEKRYGFKQDFCYFEVSEKVFTGDYKDDILFFTSCQTLKGNQSVADFFIKKGATAFLGYNDTNTVGPKAGHDFLRNMMLGYTIEESYNLLDSLLKHEVKVDFKPDNSDETYNINAKLHLLPEDGKHKNVCIVHPKVTTGDADNITPNKATLSMKVEGVNQLNKIMHLAILKDKDKKKVENPDSNSIKYVIKNINYSTFSYEQNFSDLEENTTYYYRAFLKWGEHEYSGETKEFTTSAIKVTTGDADGITPTKATLHGKVEGLDSSDKCKFAILVNKDKNTVNNFDPASKSLSYEQLKNNDGSFEKEFDNLESSTTYYYRAFACYGSHFYSGETKEFTTKEDNEPIRPYLEKLFNSTNGSNWKKNTNWCTDAPVDEWEGVSRYYYNPSLYVIDLINNGLEGSIDLSDCPYIARVYFGGNNIEDLNLKECINLVYVDLEPSYGSENKGSVKTINVSGCYKLERISLDNVKSLESVIAQNCTSLTSFSDPGDSCLVSLDLLGCTNLETVYVEDNKLTTLILKNCEKMYYLNCENNKLTSLDLSTCKGLKSVWCMRNQIRSQVPQYMIQMNEENDCSFYLDWLYEYSSSSTWLDGNIPPEWKKVEDDLYAKENKYGWYFNGEPDNNQHYNHDLR